MDKTELLIKLGVDSSGANKQIAELNKELKSMDAELKSLDKGTNDFGKNMSNMGKQVDITKNKITALQAKLDAQNQALEQANKKYQNALKAQERYNNGTEKSASETSKHQKAVEQAASQINKYNREIADTERALNIANKELAEMNAQISKMPYEKMSKGFQNVSNGLSKVSSLTRPLTAAISGLAVASINTAMSFEDAMAQISATSGATGDELEKLENKAREIGKTTSLSADEGATALLYLSQAGYDVEQSLAAVDDVVNLAVASNMDLGEATKIVTANLASYKISVDDANRVTDVLAQTASSSNTNVQELGQAFEVIAPVAGSLGYSIEDTSLALALLANNAIVGSSAGTALRSVLAKLVDPTKETAKAMEQYDISLVNSDGSAKSLKDVLLNLKTAFSTLDETQKAELASTLAGQEGMSALLAIVNSSDADFNKLSEAIGNANGKTQEMADVMANTSKGGLKELLSKLEEAFITIGQKLLPIFDKVVTKLGEALDWFNSLDSGMQDNIIKWGLLIAGISPVAGILSKLTGGLSSLFSAMASVSGETGVLGEALGGLGTKLAGGLGLEAVAIVAGGALVGGAMYGLYKAFQVIYEVGYQAENNCTTWGQYFREFGDSIDYAKQRLENLGTQSQETCAEVTANTKAMITENRKLTDEEYQESFNALQENHTKVLDELNRQKDSRIGAMEIQRDAELSLIKDKNSTEYHELQSHWSDKIAEESAKWDEYIGIENQGYQRCQNDLEMSLEEQYATDSSFREMMLASQQEYFENGQVLTGAGLGAMKQEFFEHYGNIEGRVQEFCKSDITYQREHNQQLKEDLKNAKKDEIAIYEEDYQAKLDKLKEHCDNSTGEEHEFYKNAYDALVNSHQAGLNEIEDYYNNLETKMDESVTRQQEIEERHFQVSEELRRKGYDAQAIATEEFWSKIDTYFDNGGQSMEEAIAYATGQIEISFNNMDGAVESTTSNVKTNMESAGSAAESEASRIQRAIDQIESKEVNVTVNFSQTGYDSLVRKMQHVSTGSGKYGYDPALNDYAAGVNAYAISPYADFFGGMDAETYPTFDFYGLKDTIKTLSLSSLGLDTVSSYATGDAASSSNISTINYNYGGSMTTARTDNGLNQKIDTLISLLMNRGRQQVVFENVNINAQDKSIQQIEKELDEYIRLRSRRF